MARPCDVPEDSGQRAVEVGVTVVAEHDTPQVQADKAERRHASGEMTEIDREKERERGRESPREKENSVFATLLACYKYTVSKRSCVIIVTLHTISILVPSNLEVL